MKNLELRKDMLSRSLDLIAFVIVVVICCAAITGATFAIAKLSRLINKDPVSVLAAVGTGVLLLGIVAACVWAVNRVFRGK